MYRSILVLLVANIFLAIRADELYSDIHDHLDIDAILGNPKMRNEYYDCFMDRGPCGEDAAYFKSNFAEVIATECKKCTEWQKNAFDKVADWYSKNDVKSWDAFVEKYLTLAKEMNIAGA